MSASRPLRGTPVSDLDFAQLKDRQRAIHRDIDFQDLDRCEDFGSYLWMALETMGYNDAYVGPLHELRSHHRSIAQCLEDGQTWFKQAADPLPVVRTFLEAVVIMQHKPGLPPATRPFDYREQERAVGKQLGLDPAATQALRARFGDQARRAGAAGYSALATALVPIVRDCNTANSRLDHLLALEPEIREAVQVVDAFHQERGIMFAKTLPGTSEHSSIDDQIYSLIQRGIRGAQLFRDLDEVGTALDAHPVSDLEL